jgi:2-amino-4-hydroxy-6-hydroxymethyldihydropteridine diphosphokinase
MSQTRQAEHIAYIALGANLGNAQETIQTAITKLGVLPFTRLTHSSSLYLSAPMDADGDDYVNAVVELHTQLSPADLLSELHALERRFGRIRSYQNAPRTLDLDLLLYDQLSINTDTLQLPHPRMTQRAFVMLPLLEIAPAVIIPGVGAPQSLRPHWRNQVIQKLS